MALSVDVLLPPREAAYEEMLRAASPTFAYASLAHRALLDQLLPDGEARYLVALEGDEVVGALPVYLDRSDQGTVIASLPFHASNGGVVVRTEADPARVADALLGALAQVGADEQALATSLVTDPRGWSTSLHRERFVHQHDDPRLGQWTELGRVDDGSSAERREGLWARLHGKTRNAVRKSQVSGVEIRPAATPEDWAGLLRLHETNMARLGGRPKTSSVVTALRQAFDGAAACELLVAHQGDDLVAAVLVVSALGVTEYLIPAFDEDRKDLQALSGTIWHGLERAIDRGDHTWNWGGTRVDQDGVRRFKSRWAASEAEYTILSAVHDETLLERTPADVTASHPHSYVVPYPALRSG